MANSPFFLYNTFFKICTKILGNKILFYFDPFSTVTRKFIQSFRNKLNLNINEFERNLKNLLLGILYLVLTYIQLCIFVSWLPATTLTPGPNFYLTTLALNLYLPARLSIFVYLFFVLYLKFVQGCVCLHIVTLAIIDHFLFVFVS